MLIPLILNTWPTPVASAEKVIISVADPTTTAVTTRQFVASGSVGGLALRVPGGTSDANLYTLIDETVGLSTFPNLDFFAAASGIAEIELTIDPTILDVNAITITNVDVIMHHAGTTITQDPAADITLKSSTEDFATLAVALGTTGETKEFVTFAGLALNASQITDFIIKFDWRDGTGSDTGPFPET